MIPLINERYADNGEHSHYELIDADTGAIICSEEIQLDAIELLQNLVSRIETSKALPETANELVIAKSFLKTINQ